MTFILLVKSNEIHTLVMKINDVSHHISFIFKFFFFQNHTDLLKLEFKHNDRKIIRVSCLIIAGAE